MKASSHCIKHLNDKCIKHLNDKCIKHLNDKCIKHLNDKCSIAQFCHVTRCVLTITLTITAMSLFTCNQRCINYYSNSVLQQC